VDGHEKGSGAGATRRDFIKTTTAIALGMTAPWVIGTRKAAAQVAPVIADPRFTALVIDPAAIPKFVDVLPVPDLGNSPGGWPVLSGSPLTISLKPVDCDILPRNVPAVFPVLQTPCWGYRNGASYAHTYLGPTIVGKGTSGWTDPPVGTQVTFDYSGVSSGEHLLKTGDAVMAGATTVVDKHVHGTDSTEMSEPEVRVHRPQARQQRGRSCLGRVCRILDNAGGLSEPAQCFRF
jgi:hypothetical protein